MPPNLTGFANPGPLTKAPALTRRAALLWIAAVTAGLAGCRDDDRFVELHIASDGDFLAFKPDELSCPTGAKIRLFFHHAGEVLSQQHNWVLVTPGATAAVLTAAIDAGEDKGWVPPNDKRVIAATPLCDKGGTVMVEFLAPAPGDYPFVCSNQGHGEDMHGVLHVTPS